MKQGFTLLELSIVLVIIGLIVGGITVGSDMIRSAELNSVVSDVNKYKTAMNTFELKYNALPGDIKNASSYWPTECVDGGATTCNGNGSGNFHDGSSNGHGYKEGSRAWQHMALAGVISGSYDGVYTGHTIGGTYPASSLFGMGFQFIRIGTASSCSGNGSHALYGNTNTDIIQFGASDTANGGCLSGGLLSAQDAHSIDSKMDDGAADDGKILAVMADGDTVGCAATWSNSVTTGSYNLASDVFNCRMVFLLDNH